MEISVENKATYDSLRCFISQEKGHFLAEPKVLPCCQALACLACIQSSIDAKNQFTCSRCSQENVEITNAKQLASGQSLIDQINSDDLASEINNKISVYVDQIKGDLSNRSELVERLCEQAKGEIAERVEVVKAQLDTYQQDMSESLNRIKLKAQVELKALNEQAGEAVDEANIFVASFNKMLEEFEENKSQIEVDIWQCQEYIDRLQFLDEKFRRILRRIIFEPSEWKPDESFILADHERFELKSGGNTTNE